MDASEIHEPAARALAQRELREVDAVVDGRDVAQVGVAIRVADRDIGDAVGVTPVHGLYPVRREAMHRRHHRSRKETRVGQRKEVVVVVDHVEAICLLERIRDMERLPYLRIEGGVFLQRSRTDRVEPSLRDAVRRSEQRHVHITLDESFREEGHDALPGAVVARRYAPRDGREHRDAHGVVSRGSSYRPLGLPRRGLLRRGHRGSRHAMPRSVCVAPRRTS